MNQEKLSISEKFTVAFQSMVAFLVSTLGNENPVYPVKDGVMDEYPIETGVIFK